MLNYTKKYTSRCLYQRTPGMAFLSFSTILILCLLCSICFAQKGVSNTRFQIGVVLDLDSRVGRIGSTSLSLALSDLYPVNTNHTTRVVLDVRDSKGDATEAAAAALDLLRNVEVDAIIGPQKSAQASFVIALGDAAKVPIVSFSATSPSLHPISPYFVQTCMSDSAQVLAIASIVSHFGWNQVIFIHEDSDFGSGIVPYLANALQNVNARVSYKSIIPANATLDFLHQELSKMNNMQTKVFLVHATALVASKLFIKAKEENMMREGFVWIVTSGLMDLFYSLEPPAVEAMQGVLGVKPLIPRSTKFDSLARRWKRKFIQDHPNYPTEAELGLYGLWAYDTLWTLATAVERVRFREPTLLEDKDSLRNMFSTRLSQTGPKVLNSILENKSEGLVGEFNLVNGQLIPSTFQLMNVVGKEANQVGILTSDQKSLRNNDESVKSLERIVWPGKSTSLPKGWEIPLIGKKLKIGVPVEANVSNNLSIKNPDPTDGYNFSEVCQKMFKLVVADISYPVPYEYVHIEKHQGWSYNDLILQVSRGELDGAVGDITITANRSELVDFTQPFAPGGITMICSIEPADPNNKWIFLEPFTLELWLTALGLLVLLGVALWLLEHRINSQFRGSPAEHAGMLLYFPFMSLFYAQRERVTSNFARLVVVVWMLVVLALNSTYTASLSARITVQKLKSSVKDVEELKTSKVNLGYRRGSFIHDFLINMGFNESQIKPFDFPHEIERALELRSDNHGIQAFFCVLPYAKFLLKRPKLRKNYMTWGRIYSTEGFAFAFPKDSPLVAEMSRAVIRVSGNQNNNNTFEAQWEKDEDLDRKLRIDQTKISLESFKILFGITAGIVVVCLIISLSKYLYENRDFVGRIWSSDDSVRSKLSAICKHFDQRDPKSFRSDEPGDESPFSPVKN